MVGIRQSLAKVIYSQTLRSNLTDQLTLSIKGWKTNATDKLKNLWLCRSLDLFASSEEQRPVVAVTAIQRGINTTP